MDRLTQREKFFCSSAERRKSVRSLFSVGWDVDSCFRGSVSLSFSSSIVPLSPIVQLTFCPRKRKGENRPPRPTFPFSSGKEIQSVGRSAWYWLVPKPIWMFVPPPAGTTSVSLTVQKASSSFLLPIVALRALPTIQVPVNTLLVHMAATPFSPAASLRERKQKMAPLSK